MCGRHLRVRTKYVSGSTLRFEALHAKYEKKFVGTLDGVLVCICSVKSRNNCWLTEVGMQFSPMFVYSGIVSKY